MTMKTALVVDDDHLEREYMTELLVRCGFAVRSAASVPNACHIVKEMGFDLLFLDDLMPGEEPAEALISIRRAGSGYDRKKPVVYLMGDPADENAADYNKNGFDGFIEKPADPRRLRDILAGEATEPSEADLKPQSGTQPLTTHENGIPDGIYLIEELDVNRGILNCGTSENYMSALGIFFSTLEKKADEIEEFFESGDLKNYTIKVHALKSSARVIGADALSDAARELEEAGKTQDLTFIEKNSGSLLRAYRALGEGLKAALTKDEKKGKRGADEAIIKDACRSIEEFAGQMDYELVEMVLDSLSEYSLSEDDEEMFSRVRSELNDLDWDAVIKEVRGR